MREIMEDDIAEMSDAELVELLQVITEEIEVRLNAKGTHKQQTRR